MGMPKFFQVWQKAFIVDNKPVDSKTERVSKSREDAETIKQAILGTIT